VVSDLLNYLGFEQFDFSLSPVCGRPALWVGRFQELKTGPGHELLSHCTAYQRVLGLMIAAMFLASHLFACVESILLIALVSPTLILSYLSVGAWEQVLVSRLHTECIHSHQTVLGLRACKARSYSLSFTPHRRL